MTMLMKSRNITLQRTQRGAILVTSLLILLILTVIGITAMQVTRMQERMAGNSRDTSLAFQGSEAALRDAELQLFGYMIEPIKCIDPSEACATVYERNTMASMPDNPADWWDETASEYGVDGEDELTEQGLLEDPRFAIEELAHVRNCMVQNECDRRTVYQVTARSTGGSGEAGVVLQTTYAKPPY
jgi:type IV pilus assembly protein PilX